jgi:hypothetical protein
VIEQSADLKLGSSDGHFRVEIQTLFDNQIKGISRRIDEQLEYMSTNRSGQYVVSIFSKNQPLLVYYSKTIVEIFGS